MFLMNHLEDLWRVAVQKARFCLTWQNATDCYECQGKYNRFNKKHFATVFLYLQLFHFDSFLAGGAETFE